MTPQRRKEIIDLLLSNSKKLLLSLCRPIKLIEVLDGKGNTKRIIEVEKQINPVPYDTPTKTTNH